ncbi:MAG: hypothetical protein IPJ86_02965 [Bacteroidetes bacterium]|nr:hypothetical protein [Bacteroidota bacterium]
MNTHSTSGTALLCLMILAACNSNKDQEKKDEILPDVVTVSEQRPTEEIVTPEQLNNRQDVSFTREPAPSPVSPVYLREPAVQYSEFLLPDIMHHEISAERDTILSNHQGLELAIPAGAFIHDDGSAPSGKIMFHLQSFHDDLSILKEGLTTTCNGEMIETAGMFYCDASSNGKPLKLRKSINVSFRTEEVKEGMQIFYGEKQADGVVNWIPESADRAAVSTSSTRGQTGTVSRSGTTVLSSGSGRGDELKVSGYIWDVTSATKRERFRHLEQGRPASWTSFVYGDLVKADKLLWKSVFDITRVEVNMRLLENARYELVIIPSDNVVLDSLIRLSTKNFWDKSRYPKHIDEHDDIRYASTFYLRLATKGHNFIAALKKKGKNQTVIASNATEMSMVTNYALQMTRMGWINCDRFVNLEERKDVIVFLPEGFRGSVQLATSSFRAFLPGVRHPDRMVFKGVPANEAFNVLFFDYNAKGELMVAKCKGVADGTPVSGTKFSTVTMDQLQSFVASL